MLDFSFNVNSQALALLDLLPEALKTCRIEGTSLFELGNSDFDLATSPLYNGREKGICFRISKTRHSLLIFFANDGNTGSSNRIIVYSQHSKKVFINPPLCEDFFRMNPEKRFFPPYSFEPAMDYICGLIAEFWTNTHS